MSLSIGHFSTLVLLCGLSGAGKSSALDFFSDAGFFKIDNLPVALFSNFVDYTRNDPQKFKRTAILLHIDSEAKLEELMSLLHKLDRSAGNLKLVFMDCRRETIVRRYSETRRPHPAFDAARDKTLGDTIERESLLLFPLKETSNLVVDTSEMNIHELRRSLKSFIEAVAPENERQVRVNFVSFGFKHGLPIDCDLVVDVRFLPNPHFIESLCDKIGTDRDVADYVLKSQQAQDFLVKYTELLDSLLPQYIFEGKSYLNIGVGCTGGRHRSVAIAEELAKRIRRSNYYISLTHRDSGR